MTGSRLAALLDQATKGEWEARDQGSEINIVTAGEWVASVDTSYDVPFDRAQCEADARLIALAPDMARLLVDDQRYLRHARHCKFIRLPLDHPETMECDCGLDEIRARFAALDEKAGGA